MVQDESAFEYWDVEEDSFEPLEPPPWRRWLIIAVAALTVMAMALVPLYNFIDRDPPVADNGLEVCGFDYCIVHVGGGLAGMTAGMYASRYGLRTGIVERMMGGASIINIEKIENFPGF
ncbi:MAG: hypothetical protein O7D28_05940, partial [Actinobacteria bacterium]|nr:hypothetical protein [Actinomycetota bacterium]